MLRSASSASKLGAVMVAASLLASCYFITPHEDLVSGVGAPAADGGNDGGADGGEDAAPSCEGELRACDGRCVDLSGDAQHCGACGHGCMGGRCTRGACEPTVVASQQRGPLALAVDAENVYWGTWGDPGGGAIWSCRHDDDPCVPVRLADAQQPYVMTVDATNVYVASNGNGAIGFVPRAGGSWTQLAGGQVSPRGIAVDGATVYWSKQGSPAGVLSCPLTGCGGGPSPFVSVSAPWGIAITGGTLYAASNSSSAEVGGVYACALGGCASPMKLVANRFIQNVAVDASHVYMTSFSDSGRIIRCPREGCPAPAILADGRRMPDGIAVDDQNVYWAEWGWTGGVYTQGVGQILSCPITGCPPGGPIVLASGQDQPRHIAVGAKAIYWTNYANGAETTAPNGALMRLAK